MGCGTVAIKSLVKVTTAFQYPLRAYGVWNCEPLAASSKLPSFQYPLRAYGVWNALVALDRFNQVASFSTLCGPMGCGTLLLEDELEELPIFQYPLRAYGVWNQ